MQVCGENSRTNKQAEQLREAGGPSEAVIRPAKAADADWLAWTMLAASRSHLVRGWLDVVLDGKESDCLDYLRRLTLAQARSWWHYSRFQVMEMDGRFGAALCAFRAGDAYPHSAAAMSEVAHSLNWNEQKQKVMRERSAFVFSCMMEADDDIWILEHIATLPAFRGRGLSLHLIENAVLIGQSRGLRQSQITFFIGNEPAERLYEKAGFRFADEKHHKDLETALGAPGMRRFIKDLE